MKASSAAATLVAAFAMSSMPEQLWSDGDRAALRERIGSTFAAPIFADAGIVVVDASGEPLFESNAGSALIPASAQKVLTAAAALNRFGPGYRVATRLAALAPPHSGDIEGPLWLIGGGDPYLTRDDLRNGVAAIGRSGVNTLRGPLVVDDSLFAGPEVNAHWDPGDVDGGFAAPLSAIAIDQGTVELHVTGTSPGLPASLNFVPQTRAVAISAGPLTSDGASNSIDFVPAGDRVHSFAITGSVSPGTIGKVWLPVRELGRYAGLVTIAMLAQSGIHGATGVSGGVAPLVSVTLWEHRSAPLSAMLKETLTHSNNHAADTLLRLLGASAGTSGTDDRGIAVVESELSKLGVDVSSLRLYDGSGLSASNRVTPLALAQTIAAECRGPNAGAYLRALPLVGKEGTVRDRDVKDALGRARAKTGHLRGVDTLAGTVLTRHHGRVSFAFMKNGDDAWAGAVETAQDEAVEALADF